jgi:hypothetical protein
VWEQGKILKHHPEITLVRWNGANITPINPNLATIRWFQTGNQSQ